jgi:uncharacterized protein (TIGR03067 family)
MRTRCFVVLVTGLLATFDVRGKDESPKGDLEKLQGTWSTVSLVNNGKTLLDQTTPPNPGPATKLAYEGNKWMVKVGDKIVASGITKLDSSRNPKEIDVMDETGMKNEKTKLGIYELDGDTYKYCLAPAGKPRPTGFVSREGSGHSLGVSKRDRR